MKKTSKKSEQLCKMIGYLLRESQAEEIENLVRVHHKLIKDVDLAALEDYVDRSSSVENIRMLNALNKTCLSSKKTAVSLFMEKAIREKDEALFDAAKKSIPYDAASYIVLFSIVYNDPFFLDQDRSSEPKIYPKTPSFRHPKKIQNVCHFLSETPSPLNLLVEHQSFNLVNFLTHLNDYRFQIKLEKITPQKSKFLKDERASSLFFNKANLSQLGYLDDIREFKNITFEHISRNNPINFPVMLDFLEKHVHHQTKESNDFIKDILSISSFDFLCFIKDNLRDKAKKKLMQTKDLWSFFEKSLIEKSLEPQIHVVQKCKSSRRIM